MDDFKIGPNILHYLHIKGISQRDFAKLCNIKETTLSRYISGEREPRYKTVMQMAYILGISVDELTDMNKFLVEKYETEIKTTVPNTTTTLKQMY